MTDPREKSECVLALARKLYPNQCLKEPKEQNKSNDICTVDQGAGFFLAKSD